MGFEDLSDELVAEVCLVACYWSRLRWMDWVMGVEKCEEVVKVVCR